MLSMNGIIICELILSAVLLGLIFTTFAETDLIAAPSSKSKNKTQHDGVKTAAKSNLARIELSSDVQDGLSVKLLGENDGGGSGPSGK